MRKRLIAVIMACAMSVSAGMVPVWADEEPIYWEFVTDGTEGLPAETAAHHYDFVLDRTITNKTKEFAVVYDNSGAVVNPEYENASLIIKANGKILFQKKCTTPEGLTVGNMDVQIPKQKTGTKIQIYLQSQSWKSNVKTMKVKNINTLLLSNRTDKIKKPQLTHKGYRDYIKAIKGQSLVISNGKRIVKTIKFKEDNPAYDITNLLINNRWNSELFLYIKQGKKYSKGYVYFPLEIAIAE